MNMDIQLSALDTNPLYLQLYDKFRSLVIEGILQHGDKLPSVRRLEQQLNLSKTPIETAYQMLIEEGYAVSRPRSGLYVVNPAFDLAAKSIRSEAAARRPLTAILREPALVRQPVIDYDLLSVDEQSFPVRTWRAALNEALSSPTRILQQYGDSQGEHNLRVSLTNYLRTSRGLVCSPEQIIVGTGISQSIHFLSQLLGTSSAVAFEAGGIAQVRDIFDRNGFRIIDVPLNDPESAASAFRKHDVRTVYVTPSHRHSGIPMPYAMRVQLLRWASAGDRRYVIEDDYDGEFRYSGRTIPSLQGMDASGVVIYIGTFSKAISPALRMNYMVLPESLIDKLQANMHLIACPSRIEQTAMHWFMERGHWYKQIRRMRNLYRRKREALTRSVEQHLYPHVSIEGDKAGLHLELTVKTDRTAGELRELAARNGVRIYISASAASPSSLSYPRVYLGYGGIRSSDMERGIVLLKQAWAAVLEGT
jgi:GntR family transcriptional regulator / MocR family aminotransferase